MADTEAQQEAGTLESPEDVKTKAAFVRRWLDAINLSSEEEKSWRKTSEEARQVYEAGEDAPTGTAFNLYYSYIETVCPSLYNSSPVPDIRRRFNDKDPIAKEGADTIERVISYSIDEYDFDDTFGDAVFDLATTGRGVARVKYIPELIEDGSDVGAQSVECECVPWASFRRGPARKWGDVPWIAFADYMDKDSLKKLNPAIEVPLNYVTDKNGDHKEGAEQDDPEKDIFKRALVWTIWDKDTRKVIFIAPSYPDDVITSVDDPLGLKQFFPTPRPMMTGKASGRLVPLSPYKILKPQVKEIERLTIRINKLIKTLRPRGLGPDGVDVEKWASADDGEIVQVSDVAKWLTEGGAGAMDKLIAWFPMDPTVKAIQELYTRREQAKLEFFEVGGQADIMRGQSNPNETLGAQQKKENWGSLRLKKAQAEVQRFARDLFRLKAEIIAEKFTPANLGVMAGINLQTGNAEQDALTAQKWDATLKLIKDEKMRGYRIDVETDSTIRGDATRNQESMAQFVAGSGQYFTAVAPMVEAKAMSKTAAIKIYSAFCRNFKLGKEVDAELDKLAEDALKADEAEAQQGPPPNPEMEKVKAQIEGDKAKLQIEGQKAQLDAQVKTQTMQMDQQTAQQKAALDMEKMQQEMALKREIAIMEFQLKRDLAMEEMQMKKQIASEDVGLKKQVAHEDIKIKEKTAENDRKLKAQGKDGGTKVHNGPGVDADEIGKALEGLGKMLTQSQQQTAQLIAAGNQQVVKALTAPKTVTTPDGRTYTAQTGRLN